MWTKSVAHNVDIFESEITDGMDEIYAQSPKGRFTPKEAAATEANVAFEDAETKFAAISTLLRQSV